MNRIMALDRDAFARTGLRIHLIPHGYEVLEAGHVHAALELLRTMHPKAVILDLALPAGPGSDSNSGEACGFETVQALRRIMPTLGVVILTHSRDQLDAFLTLVRQGVRGIAYKLKGIQPDQLAEVLRRVMAGGTEIDTGVAGATQDLAEHLLRRLTVEEYPWVQRALGMLDLLTPQEARAVRLLASSHNLAGIAHNLAIQRADTLVGRVYVKLGLDEMPRQAQHLRQNAILIKATQIRQFQMPQVGDARLDRSRLATRVPGDPQPLLHRTC